jgi:Lysozyme like domain
MAVIAVCIVIGVAVVMMAGSDTFVSALTGNMTAEQIAQYADEAGFSGPDLQVAVAVALAESSGDPNAMGDPTLGMSVGLWQINLKAHPQYTQAQLLDPQTNANAAYAIYQAAGSTFTPWSTYNGGQYSAYIVQAQESVNT